MTEKGKQKSRRKKSREKIQRIERRFELITFIVTIIILNITYGYINIFLPDIMVLGIIPWSWSFFFISIVGVIIPYFIIKVISKRKREAIKKKK